MCDSDKLTPLEKEYQEVKKELDLVRLRGQANIACVIHDLVEEAIKVCDADWVKPERKGV